VARSPRPRRGRQCPPPARPAQTAQTLPTATPCRRAARAGRTLGGRSHPAEGCSRCRARQAAVRLGRRGSRGCTHCHVAGRTQRAGQQKHGRRSGSCIINSGSETLNGSGWRCDRVPEARCTLAAARSRRRPSHSLAENRVARAISRTTAGSSRPGMCLVVVVVALGTTYFEAEGPAGWRRLRPTGASWASFVKECRSLNAENHRL